MPIIEDTLLRLLFYPIYAMLRRILSIRIIALWRFYRLIPHQDREKHSFLTGRSGSGKSEFLKILIYTLIRKKRLGAVVVIDPHGDMVDEIARFKEFRKNNRLILIDPYFKKGHSVVLNPLQIKSRTEQAVDIQSQELTRAFQHLLKGANLTLQMECLLVPCLAVLLCRKGSDLNDLQRFMDDTQNRDLVDLGKQSPNSNQARFFLHAFHHANYQISKRSLYTKLQMLLNSSGFARLVSGPSSLDLESELEQGKVILFNLSKGKMGPETSEAFGRLVIAMLQGYAMRRAAVGKWERTPIHLFIDEFQNYVSPSIELILTEARKYGLHLTLASQIVGQGMDTELTNIVLANTNIKIIGMNGYKSHSALSRETGVSIESLQRLGPRQFFVAVGIKSPKKFYVPGFLAGNRRAMSWKDWARIRATQITRYYRPHSPPSINEFRPPVTPADKLQPKFKT